MTANRGRVGDCDEPLNPSTDSGQALELWNRRVGDAVGELNDLNVVPVLSAAKRGRRKTIERLERLERASVLISEAVERFELGVAEEAWGLVGERITYVGRTETERKPFQYRSSLSVAWKELSRTHTALK